MKIPKRRHSEVRTLYRQLLMVLFAVLLIAGCGDNPVGPDVDGPDTQNPDTTVPDDTGDITDTLDALGVDTNVGSRTDPNGLDLRDDYNPLGGEITTLGANAEIFLIGDAGDTLLDDDFSSLASSTDVAWQDLMKGDEYQYLSADVNGDGLDEIVIVIPVTQTSLPTTDHFLFRTIENDGNSFQVTETYVDSGLQFSTVLTGLAPPEPRLTFGASAGDFDGDGCDELAVTAGRYLFALDDADHGYAIIAAKELIPVSDVDATFLRPASGDFDQDGRDELVVTSSCGNITITGEVMIFDDLVTSPSLSSLLLQKTILSVNADGTHSISRVTPAVDDFDGDALPEIAIAGADRDGDGTTFGVLMLDTIFTANSTPSFSLIPAYYSFTANATDPAALTGGNVLPVIQSGRLGDLSSRERQIVFLNKIIAYDGLTQSFSEVKELIATFEPYSFERIGIGDLDGDTIEELLVLNSAIDVYHYNPNTNQLSTTTEPSDGNYRYIVTANADNDGDVVRYVGHETIFTEPHVVAVLASPPYTADCHDLADSCTEFGYISSSGTSETTSFGFSVGLSLGFSAGSEIIGIEMEMKTSIEMAFDYAASRSHEYTETWGYSSGADHDTVIFTSIPLDVYYYELLSYHDGVDDGEIVTINLPRKPQMYNATLSFYNDHNGDADDIVLPHTIGNPFTYMTRAQRDALKVANNSKGLYSTTSMVTGTGAATTISIEELTTQEQSYAFDCGVSVELEIVAGSVLFGGSLSVHAGYEYTTSVTQGTYIAGTVGPIIEDQAASAENFSWGLLMYPETQGNQKFSVVSYWVDR